MITHASICSVKPHDNGIIEFAIFLQNLCERWSPSRDRYILSHTFEQGEVMTCCGSYLNCLSMDELRLGHLILNPRSEMYTVASGGSSSTCP